MIEDNSSQFASLAELLASPDYYPARLSVPEKQIEVVRMSRASYRQSPFLDHRIIPHGDESRVLLFSDIQGVSAKYQEVHAHYIFHNAFSCSTMLTRYLDMLPDMFVLREPNILYEVATLKRFEKTPTSIRLEGVAWEDLYRFVRLMIGRRYDESRPTIIKPTDGCNSMMYGLVDARPENRGLFVYSTLEKFLVSVLRLKQRHGWARIRVQELLLDTYNETGSLLINPATLSVAQAAALVWLLHTDQYIRSTQAKNGCRFNSLNASQLSSRPTDSLAALCGFFQLQYEKDEIRCAADSTRTDVDAKLSNEVFDPEQRRNEYEATRAVHREEIEQAIGWVAGLHPARDLFAALPNPLL